MQLPACAFEFKSGNFSRKKAPTNEWKCSNPWGIITNFISQEGIVRPLGPVKGLNGLYACMAIVYV